MKNRQVKMCCGIVCALVVCIALFCCYYHNMNIYSANTDSVNGEFIEYTEDEEGIVSVGNEFEIDDDSSNVINVNRQEDEYYAASDSELSTNEEDEVAVVLTEEDKEDIDTEVNSYDPSDDTEIDEKSSDIEVETETGEKAYSSSTKLTKEDLNDLGKISNMVESLASEHQKIMEVGAEVDALAQSMGISTKEVGSSTVDGLTVDNEPYYSILHSVNAFGYFWTIKGDVADTVHLFYQTQDDEIMYYGLVDLLGY